MQTLAPDTLQNIVNNVEGISSVSEINYLADDNISSPADPTDEMTQTVQEDQHEIIGALSSVKVDTSGWYVTKLTLSDELFETVKGMSVNNLKVYSLADSESQPQAALISGILNTWELLSLSGEKIDTIGTRELLMVGLLEAGQSFSMFLAKLIIALLAGGCTCWFHVHRSCSSLAPSFAQALDTKRPGLSANPGLYFPCSVLLRQSLITCR